MYQYAVVTLKHKWYVAQACRQVGVPWHMALMHDWSKFRLTEYVMYQHEFFGNGETGKVTGSRAHYAFKIHYRRNKHHWQYWVTDKERREADLMPQRYAREMVADWMGASRAYAGTWDISPWMNRHAHEMILHPLTRHYVYETLGTLGYYVIDPANMDEENLVTFIYPLNLCVSEWIAARGIMENDTHRYAGRRIIMGKLEDLQS